MQLHLPKTIGIKTIYSQFLYTAYSQIHPQPSFARQCSSLLQKSPDLNPLIHRFIIFIPRLHMEVFIKRFHTHQGPIHPPHSR